MLADSYNFYEKYESHPSNVVDVVSKNGATNAQCYNKYYHFVFSDDFGHFCEEIMDDQYADFVAVLDEIAAETSGRVVSYTKKEEGNNVVLEKMVGGNNKGPVIMIAKR